MKSSRGSADTQRPKVALLWSANSSYLSACIDALGIQADVTLFCAHPHRDAPFANLTGHYSTVHVDWRRSSAMLGVRRELRALRPDLVLCGGWAARRLFVATGAPASTRVLCIDSRMPGGAPTIAKALVARPLVRSFFSHAFVPGNPQVPVAGLLGFTQRNTTTGLYCASTPAPQSIPAFDRPRQFAYVGRLHPVKGIASLLDAYSQYRQSVFMPWSLELVGAGPLAEACHEQPGVTVHGFKEGEDLQRLLTNSRALILPSLSEPWGVVVHEAAHAGCALVLSDAVGAGTTFLLDGLNGYSFPAGNAQAMAGALRSIHSWSQEQLAHASSLSSSIARTKSTDHWADAVLGIASR